MLLLDAGDALSPNQILTDDQRARVVATAEFIVQQYGDAGVDALGLGDRDLALGAEALKKLAANGKVPFLSTNLVDANGQPVFQTSLVIERAGVRVLVVSLIGESAQRMAERSLAINQWRFEKPAEATRKALAATTPPPDLVVVLSQLSSAEEAALNEAVPEARVFLGGDSMGMAPDTSMAGTGVSANGGQKGKQVGFLTISFDDPRGASAPLVDPGRRDALEARKVNAERRIQNLEKLIAQAKDPAPVAPEPNARPVRRQPIEAYERQLAGTRAELQLAVNELASLGDAKAQAGNTVALDLVQMDTTIVDEPKTAAAVEAFRKLWPDPSKSPPPPLPQAPLEAPAPPQPTHVP